MDIVAILGIAGSVSVLAGWRLYLCIAATGLAMRWGALPLPEHLVGLEALANPWVIAIAGFAAVAEFFADKVMWLDSVWDAVHSVVRPVGGALLTLAIIDPADPAVQVVAFLLGGGASLAAHAGKAGARAVVNTSPEPVSNLALSSAEDIVSAGALYAVYQYPEFAAALAVLLLASIAGLLFAARRVLKRVFSPRRPAARGPD